MGRAGWPAAVSWRWGEPGGVEWMRQPARWLVFATGVAAGSLVSLLFGRATQQSCADAAAAAPRAQTNDTRSAQPSTTRGRVKSRGEKAFVLAVELRFRDAAAAEAIVKEWALAAEYCLVHEPFLFHYEIARSDKDPLRYMVYERYRSKADYIGPHKLSPAFAAFRPKLKEMQESARVEVVGESWDELGVGFV